MLMGVGRGDWENKLFVSHGLSHISEVFRISRDGTVGWQDAG